jgi:hypothetical protein
MAPFRFPQKLWKSCEYRPWQLAKVTMIQPVAALCTGERHAQKSFMSKNFHRRSRQAEFLLSQQIAIRHKDQVIPMAKTSLASGEMLISILRTAHYDSSALGDHKSCATGIN